jgi:hypothetical protein
MRAEVRASFQTVEIFSKLLGRKLYLKNAAKAHTSSYIITVPFDSANLYTEVEQALSYAVFGSDARARDMFASLYAEEALKRYSEYAVLDAKTIRSWLTTAINILEAERVLSLWGRLYAGSEARIRSFRHNTNHDTPDEAMHDALKYFQCLAAGHYPEDTEFLAFREVFEEALGAVRYGTFDTTLLATKNLLARMVHLLSSVSMDPHESEEQKVAAFSQIIETKTEPAPPPAYSCSQYAPEEAAEAAYDRAVRALNQDVGNSNQLDHEFGRQRVSMNHHLQNLEDKASRVSRSRDEDVAKNVEARVLFEDVEGHYVLPDIPEDEAATARLRSFFIRVLGKRTHGLEDQGTTVDVAAHLQQKVAQRTGPVFRASPLGRGFHMLILLDLSSSMRGERARQCLRTHRVLQKALDFPFVTLDVWGFNSTEGGVITIRRFSKKVGLDPNDPAIHGTTPLHLAVRVGRKHLEASTAKKHICIVTDGAPIQYSREMETKHTHKEIPRSTLLRLVQEEVQRTREAGIGVTTAVIPDGMGKLPDALSYEDLGAMFGPTHSWQVLKDDQTFAHDLARLVSSSFSKFLRHG